MVNPPVQNGHPPHHKYPTPAGESLYPLYLLTQARRIYDDPEYPLANSARQAWTTFFASGALWMKEALTLLRGQPITECRSNWNVLGSIKYGLASVGAFLPVAGAWFWDCPWLLILCIPVFYAIEGQMIFLFPLAMDGCSTPFSEAWRYTRRAGGTLKVMGVVLPLAFVMIFGGFFGQGFVRCWCLGCLSVCLWYEEIRLQIAAEEARKCGK